MNKLTLSLIDDDDAFRCALIKQLQNYNCFNILYSSSKSEEALSHISQLNCDVAILDYMMPVMNGLQLLRELRSYKYTGKIIILTSIQDETYFKEFYESGANFCLLKGKISELVSKINSYLFKKNGNIIEFNSLNEIEMKIIIEICNDLTNVQIAEKLNLSKRTVETYRQKISEKILIPNSTVSLVKYAVQKGYYKINSDFTDSSTVSR
ncbi:MAG: response regulator [Bacteroidia bacterium]